MSLIRIRKKLLNIETIFHEGGDSRPDPLEMGAIAVVINNPYAGHYVKDLTELVEASKELAKSMVPELLDAMGGADKVESYGKGAIVGVNGELEHGAIWHEAGGWSLRAHLPKAKSIVPPLATSNSPTFGRANSPGQDGLIINHQCLRAQGVRPLP